MPQISLLLKSYQNDLRYAERLVESFTAHNADGLHLWVLVPDEDRETFAYLAREHVTVESEQPLAHHFVTEPVLGLRPGYINQEIVKLSFHELGRSENYFCVDSDAVFIRDFRAADFIAPDGAPYSVLVEDRELAAEPRYYRQYWQSREAHIRRIAETIGFTDPVLRTCHGHQVFSSTVLRSFVSDFLEPRGWSYRDALALAPLEFSWYSLWLQHSAVIPIHQREPLVKVFHHEDQHIAAISRGITMEDLARGYLAVVVNANFARELATAREPRTKAEALVPYLSYAETLELVRAKLADSFRRRFGREPSVR